MEKKNEKTELVSNIKPESWVEKSDPLLIMKDIPFSLGELKLLDIYLSRINAANPQQRTVIFTKEEYEKLMGFKNADGRTLDRNTDKLLTKTVKLKVGEYFDKYVLFERASYKELDGKKVVTIKCTESAQDFFFCLQKYHYSSYELRNVLGLSSIHSYLLYLHVRTNRYRGTWTVSLQQLRDEILDLRGQTSYQEYKIFRRAVLLPAVQELNEKTDCSFDIKPIKNGRLVRAIEFIYHSDEPEQLTMFDAVLPETKDYDEDNDLAQICEFSFNADEMKLLSAVIERLCVDTDTVRECYSRMKVYEKNTKIKNRLLYLVQILKKETKNKDPKKAQSFDIDEFMEAALNRARGVSNDNT